MLAEKWSTPPWKISGEKITAWRRFVWFERHACYEAERQKYLARERKKLEHKKNG